MAYKKHIYIIEPEERQREQLRERVESFFRNTYDLPFVELIAVPTPDALPSVPNNGSAIILYSCPATPPYTCLDTIGRLNGSVRAVLTDAEPTQQFRKRVAEINESALILPKLSLFKHHQTASSNALYSALTTVRDDALGVIGAGGIGGSLALRALGQYGIKQLFLYNGHNQAKAEHLAEELEKKIIAGGRSSGFNIVVADDIQDIKFNCGSLLFSVGHRELEKELTRDPSKTRKDFLSLYIKDSLAYAALLTGYSGNLIDVTNPVSMIMYLLYAGSYKEPTASDQGVCRLRIEGLSSDHLRGKFALIQMGKEVGLFEGNGYKTSIIQGVDLHLVGTRDKYVIHRPTIAGRTLEEVQELARQKGLSPEKYTLDDLVRRIQELGIERIRETETYYPDSYSDTLLNYLASILGKIDHAPVVEHCKKREIGFRTLPAMSLVDLFHDTSFDRIHGEFMQGEDGKKKNIKKIYRHNFHNGAMINWEIYHTPNGDPVNSYIRLSSPEFKLLLNYLLEERNFLLSTVEGLSDLSPMMELTREKVFAFFTRKLRSNF